MPEQERPEIPLIEVPSGEEPAVAALRAEPERLRLLLCSARKTYTPLGLRSADKLSRLWARRAATPLGEAIAAVDRAMGRPGAYLLNYSYEWGCTTGAAEDPEFGGPTLMRTLDWPFDGLGQALVATRCEAEAGAFFSLTWPGYAGVLTGLAPGRFAAAINQPPLPGVFGAAIGWPLARWRVGASREMPPSHLLRLAFETCRTFDAAVALLRRTPICIPAIFTLAGAKPGETITIERTEHQAFIAPEPAAANHWASCPGPRGRPRDRVSIPRRAAMRHLLGQKPDWSLDWMRPPIHVPQTRLVAMANPATGRMAAQGFEKTGPATEVLEIE
jgi:hypothetical protein